MYYLLQTGVQTAIDAPSVIRLVGTDTDRVLATARANVRQDSYRTLGYDYARVYVLGELGYAFLIATNRITR